MQARCMYTNNLEHSNRNSYICRPGACTLTAWITLIGIAIYAGQARCMNTNSLEHSNRNSYICRPGNLEHSNREARCMHTKNLEHMLPDHSA